MSNLIEKMRERRLARRMAAGERRAFAEFVDCYGLPLRRLARANTRNNADAEDLTQEIMIAIARGIGSFRGEAGLKTWAMRIALNLCIKHRERRPEATESMDETTNIPDPLPSPEAAAERTEFRERVHSSIDRLSDEHRDVVLLHELQGLTYSECAGALDIPIGTVKSRLSNAFRKLRTSLADCAPGYNLTESPASRHPKPAGAEAEG